MKIIKSIDAWKICRRKNMPKEKSIGLVATMGCLHAGHTSLLTRSLAETDITVLSIFLNPTQFDNPEDLQDYPGDLSADLKLAEELGVDYILQPDYAELYPDNYRYKICENTLSHKLCGQAREGHFDGVLTIVMKLLQLVSPTRAYFGEKDYQQLQLIQDMVKAFFLDIDIIACETVRDENGLALSSRNFRLSKQEYQLAVQFAKILPEKKPLSTIKAKLDELGIKIDYLEEYQKRRFAAVFVGDVRLIDNIEVTL